MTPQDLLNKAARAHGWANWSEVLLHNAPPHVINLIVEEAMRGEPVGKPEPALTWRPGAMVRITGRSTEHKFDIGQNVLVQSKLGNGLWICLDGDFYTIGSENEFTNIGYPIIESDAVVVG